MPRPNNKVMLILSAVLVAGLAGYALALKASRIGETKVSVTAIPATSSIYLNDRPVGAGDIYLKPGVYAFTAKSHGWKDDKLKVEVSDYPVEVGLTPEPDSDEAYRWINVNRELQLQREAIGGLQAERQGNKIAEKSPIVNALPYQDILGPFKVDYGKSDIQDDGIFIEVSSSTPPGRTKFLEWLKQQGQDPTDLEIKYHDFLNPFYAIGGPTQTGDAE